MDATDTINPSTFCRKHGFPRNLLYDHLKRFVDEQREDGRSSREEFPERGFYVTFDREASRTRYHITDEEAFKEFALRLTDYAVLTSDDLEILINTAEFAKEAAFKEGDWRLISTETNKSFNPKMSYWVEVCRVLEKVR